jgi:hypothetical protein
MKRIIAQVKFCDNLNNKKTLNVYINKDEGTISYLLINPKTRIAHSLCSLQFGRWSDDLLPDVLHGYNSNHDLFNDVLLAVEGCVFRNQVVEKLLF